MLQLRFDTSPDWIVAVRADFDGFLQDHAANERKVSQSALSLVTQHPERPELVEGLIDVAREELEHFHQVYELLKQRGQGLAQDVPDPYMGAFRRLLRKGDVAEYLLDRLLVFGIVEARGCERFALVAAGAEDPAMREFYTGLAASEARHHGLYSRLARLYFGEQVARARADVLLDAEAAIVAQLPVRAALH